MFEIGVTGDLARASELYLRARDLAREIGDRGMEGTAFSNLGFVAGLQGDFEAAREHLEKALLASQEMDDVYTEIFALVNLSSNACIQKQTVMALERCERAIELSQKAGEISGEAWGWLYLGHARLLMGELEPARSAFEKSLFLREQLGQSTLAMEPLAGLVETALQEDDLDRAVANAEKILAHLATGGTLNGTDEPLRVYYVCYELLQKKQDPRSSQVLQAGIELLEANIAKLKDDHAREMYVANVPWRLALRNAASKMS
jgi:tetratricopeptide (TPR) repeat protein